MKKDIRERIAEMTEIPKDFVMNMPRTTLIGNREVYIDNYTGLIEYNDKIIRLSAKKGMITVSGDDLIITRITDRSIFVGGNIMSVELMQRNKK